MNEATARRLVLVSLGSMFAVIAVRSAQGKEPGSAYRRLWATGALALLLSTLADFAPQLAGPFALLVGMTYLMGAENTIADWLHTGLGSKQAAAAGASSAGAAAAAAAKGGSKQ